MSRCFICGDGRSKVIQRWREYSILKCRQCSVIFVAPLPPKNKHKEFHNQEYFRKYYGGTIEDFYKTGSLTFLKEAQLKSARLGYVSRFCDKGKILDVGTGQGLFSVLATEHGWDAFGTDISGYVCEFLSKSKHIKMFNGYLEELDLPSDYFDVVTMWHLLEHTYDPHKTLQEVKKILKTGGHLFIAVPNTLPIEIYSRKLFKKPYFREDADEWHFYGFNTKVLKYLLKKLSFKVDSVDSEYYLKGNKVNMIYNYISRLLLRFSGIDICRTIIIHAVKTELRV